MAKIVYWTRWIALPIVAIGTFWISSILVEFGSKFSIYFIGDDPDGIAAHFLQTTLNGTTSVFAAFYVSRSIAPSHKHFGIYIAAIIFFPLSLILAYANYSISAYWGCYASIICTISVAFLVNETRKNSSIWTIRRLEQDSILNDRAAHDPDHDFSNEKKSEKVHEIVRESINEPAAKKAPAKKAAAPKAAAPKKAPAEKKADGVEHLVLETTKGTVVIKFRPDLAPNHVARISELAKSKFYDGIVFHRVIDGFMAQTGDPTGTGMGGSGHKLKAEFNAEPHVRGICSMARSQNPDSGDSQFFICFDNARFLDRQYTVWGQVVEGMENVDKFKRGEPVHDPDKIVTTTLELR